MVSVAFTRTNRCKCARQICICSKAESAHSSGVFNGDDFAGTAIKRDIQIVAGYTSCNCTCRNNDRIAYVKTLDSIFAGTCIGCIKDIDMPFSAGFSSFSNDNIVTSAAFNSNKLGCRVDVNKIVAIFASDICAFNAVSGNGVVLFACTQAVISRSRGTIICGQIGEVVCSQIDVVSSVSAVLDIRNNKFSCRRIRNRNITAGSIECSLIDNRFARLNVFQRQRTTRTQADKQIVGNIAARDALRKCAVRGNVNESITATAANTRENNCIEGIETNDNIFAEFVAISFSKVVNMTNRIAGICANHADSIIACARNNRCKFSRSIVVVNVGFVEINYVVASACVD